VEARASKFETLISPRFWRCERPFWDDQSGSNLERYTPTAAVAGKISLCDCVSEDIIAVDILRYLLIADDGQLIADGKYAGESLTTARCNELELP
jgi:hypothetical protein